MRRRPTRIYAAAGASIAHQQYVLYTLYESYALSTVHPLLNGRLLLLSQSAVAMLRLFFYVFAQSFLFNPHFDLEPQLTIS